MSSSSSESESAASSLPPSEWVVRFAHLVPPVAQVLDLACGSGRHARFFAGRGASVVAVDRDPQALAALATVAGVRILQADLEGASWPFQTAQFDAIVVTNYLHRPLFPDLVAALRPGGVLIYETFMLGNQAFGPPSNPQFLLAPDELLHAFVPPLALVAFEQGVIRRPAAVQRLVAIAAGPSGGKSTSESTSELNSELNSDLNSIAPHRLEID